MCRASVQATLALAFLTNPCLASPPPPLCSYVQLQLLSRWDLGINSLALCKFADSAACFEQLYQGSNWSKATYC